GHELLDLPGWDAQPGGLLGLILADQRAGDVIAVACAVLDRVARRHPVAFVIKQQPGEQARLASPFARVALGEVDGKLRLNRIPQRLLDDRRVVARIGLFLVNDLAPIDAVLQHQVERAAREWLATPEATRSARPGFALDAPGFEFV